MNVHFYPGDIVECTRDCDNGFDEHAKKWQTYTVSACVPHPLFDGIWLLYLDGMSQDYGFSSGDFNKVQR